MKLESLINEIRENFSNCLNLENQGHSSLKKAILGCYRILRTASKDDLNGLLTKHQIDYREKDLDKNKAQVVLWLTIGKPTSEDTSELERQKARIRMYARILNKFSQLNVDHDEAKLFLEQYGVYAVANLKKLENEENNEGNDSSYEEDDEDDENIDTENQYTNEDNNTKKSSQIRTALKANGITKKHLILIKQEKDVLFCSGTNTTKSVVSFLQKKKIQLKNIDEL